MKYVKSVLIITALYLNLNAQDTKYGGAFLELGIGPRALGLGSAYVALAEDGSGFYWNPAGMAFISDMQVSLMYADLFNSLENHSFASASVPIFGKAVITASWIRLAVDDIPEYNDNDLGDHNRGQRYSDPEGIGLTDPALGNFTFANNAYFITFSKLSRWNADLGWQYFELPIDIAYGLNFKMLDIGLENQSGTGLGLDGGFRVSMGLDDLFADENYGRLSLGMSIIDLFQTTITWDTKSKQKDEIERSWRYGFAYEQPLLFIDSHILFIYDLNTQYDGSAHLGFEFDYKRTFAVRFGSNDGEFTTGAGLTYWKVKLDYAYQIHDLGNLHRVGISLYF